nr:MAG TPA: hypothetical protein [Caudoviricetes sp.]
MLLDFFSFATVSTPFFKVLSHFFNTFEHPLK